MKSEFGKELQSMDVIKTQQISSRPIEKVVVHPLVLLSIVDNYNRVAKDTRKRVVGVLLGSSFKGTVDVTNSYAGTDLISLSFFFLQYLGHFYSLFPFCFSLSLKLDLLVEHQFRLVCSKSFFEEKLIIHATLS